MRLSRKRNQQDNLADCGKRLWVNADPFLEQMRQNLLPVCSNCQTRGHGKRHPSWGFLSDMTIECYLKFNKLSIELIQLFMNTYCIQI